MSRCWRLSTYLLLLAYLLCQDFSTPPPPYFPYVIKEQPLIMNDSINFLQLVSLPITLMIESRMVQKGLLIFDLQNLIKL